MMEVVVTTGAIRRAKL